MVHISQEKTQTEVPGWMTNMEHRRRRRARERGGERESEIVLIRRPEKATVFRLSEVFVRITFMSPLRHN